MTNRRFNEAEVAEIFERASELQHTGSRQIPPSEGMTLSQLQEIGREVGISPESLTLAAQAVERGGQPTSSYFLGLPTGVGMSADLGRVVTDQEWEGIVLDLRETFDARGKLSHEGSFRQWTNGNLQALLEPTPAGHRLRLRTVKGDARGLMTGGLAMLGFAVTTGIVVVAQGAFDDTGMIMALTTLATMGAGMFGVSSLRLPGWARLRKEQMEGVLARAAASGDAKQIPDLTRH